MNFMRPESWAGGWADDPPAASIRHGITRSPRRPTGRRDVPLQGDFRMQWQTPTATDLRFGFEITLYVTAR